MVRHSREQSLREVTSLLGREGMTAIAVINANDDVKGISIYSNSWGCPNDSSKVALLSWMTASHLESINGIEGMPEDERKSAWSIVLSDVERIMTSLRTARGDEK